MGSVVRQEVSPRRVGWRDIVGRLPALLTEPTLPVIMLAGLAQVARAYAVDIVLFFGTAALIVWDAPRWPSRSDAPHPPRVPTRERVWLLVALIAYGGMVAQLPRDAVALDGAMAGPGLVVLWASLGLGRGDAARPTNPGATSSSATSSSADAAGAVERSPHQAVEHEPSPGPGSRWLVWPALGLVLGLIELASWLSQSDPRTDSPDHPTVSTVVEPWLDATTARAIALAGWLAMGWWLLRRLRAWAAA